MPIKRFFIVQNKPYLIFIIQFKYDLHPCWIIQIISVWHIVCKQENTYDVIMVFYVKNHVELPDTVTILTEFIVSTGRFVERIADGG